MNGVECFLIELVPEKGVWKHEAWCASCYEDHVVAAGIGPDMPILSDTAWPARCPGCGAALDFTPGESSRSGTYSRWYRRNVDGVEGKLSDFGGGAIFESQYEDYRVNGGRGPAWAVVLPNGMNWYPGSEASNCDRKGQDHDCWCVHGDAPMLTVDNVPAPGRSTCSAGAGSIVMGDWHGLLRDGHLVVA